MNKKFLFIKIILLLVTPAMILDAQKVEVVITGIRSLKGQMVIGVFKDDESFRKEESYLELRFPKKDIINGEMRVEFSLEAGTYGISLLDDENGDGEMEYNFIGLPKEGFGFSDYYHTGITRPKFDSYKFILNKYQTYRVTIRIKYM